MPCFFVQHFWWTSVSDVITSSRRYQVRTSISASYIRPLPLISDFSFQLHNFVGVFLTVSFHLIFYMVRIKFRIAILFSLSDECLVILKGFEYVTFLLEKAYFAQLRVIVDEYRKISCLFQRLFAHGPTSVCVHDFHCFGASSGFLREGVFVIFTTRQTSHGDKLLFPSTFIPTPIPSVGLLFKTFTFRKPTRQLQTCNMEFAHFVVTAAADSRFFLA